MKRVLMIAAAFPPSNSAGVHRTARFARMLPEFGWEPVVLTQTEEDGTELPEWVNALRVVRRGNGVATGAGSNGAVGFASGGSSQEGGSTELGRELPVLRSIKTLVGNSRDLVLETPDRDVGWALFSSRAAMRLSVECNVDAIYTSGPPHSLHLLGRRMKRRLGIPWVADFRDPWARKPWGHKPRNPWGQRLLGPVESLCVRNADVVILNTERMADEFRSHYAALPGERFVAIPNGCDPELADRVRELVQPPEPTSGEGDGFIRLLHPGSLYRQRDPRPIVDAMRLLHREGLRIAFEQIGPCHPRFGLTEYVRERGLSEWVTIKPPVPHDDVLRRMAHADVLVLIQPGTDLQVPGKLFEMLLYRKPILALADAGATADIIGRYRLGAVAQGDDRTAIAAAIKKVVEQSVSGDDAAGWDEACRDFDGRQLTGELAKQLDRMTGRQIDEAAAVKASHRNAPSESLSIRG